VAFHFWANHIHVVWFIAFKSFTYSAGPHQNL